jgi:hypothetical protein
MPKNASQMQAYVAGSAGPLPGVAIAGVAFWNAIDVGHQEDLRERATAGAR